MTDLCAGGSRMVVVTHGREPTLAFDGSRAWRVSAPRIAAVNPIGSGDAFTAALTARLLKKEDLGQACRWGTAAGAANALTWMAGEVLLSDVESLLISVRVEAV
jgi:tagatose 6-phosphate kinase